MAFDEGLQRWLVLLEKLDKTGTDIIAILPNVKKRLDDPLITRDGAVAVARILVDGLEQSYEESRVVNETMTSAIKLLMKMYQKTTAIDENH